MKRDRGRILLIGWDAADWKVARPLMDRGEMPHLARLVATGSSGNIGTLEPPLSPMLWTSIATGKRPPKHGILGFNEPTPDGLGVRPVTVLGRTTKAIWNILNQNGVRPCVVGWWPSHPAEPVNGVTVSNYFQQAGDGPEPLPLSAGTVHPAEWHQRLAGLRLTPMDLPGEVIRLFVPEYDRVDQDKDKRLHVLGKVVAETLNIQAAALEILEHAEWDFAAVYLDSIDHFSHLFMCCHPPRLPWVDKADFEIYQHVIANAYRYHDAMLGRLLHLAGTETTVILMSDHGFHPDNLRPGYIPAEAAEPAVEHRAFGMITLNGPKILSGRTLHGSSLLDVAPTILHLFDLPIGRDMDGKVLMTAIKGSAKVAAIDSWDAVDGDAGTHPPDAWFDPVASAEVMKQLAALGYVAPPGPDAAKNVAECLAALRYNLARAHDDAGRFDKSLPLYESLHAHDPDSYHFVERLVDALIETNDNARARAVLDAFDVRCQITAPSAQAELVRRCEARSNDLLNPEFDAADHRELFERRLLSERATGFSLLRKVLRIQIDLADGRFDEARRDLDAVEGMFRDEGRLPALFLVRAYAQLGDDDHALAWVERAIKRDPDDWQALALAARLHLRNRRFAASVDAAAASLALIYFQPMTYFTLGRALAARGELDEAEQAFRMAVNQRPGMVVAHAALARLCSRQGRHGEAALYQSRVTEVRERIKRRHEEQTVKAAAPRPEPPPMPTRNGPQPLEPGREVVVVAGLPRSGTSMLMQVLAAGGVTLLTDSQRRADPDNPRGYFEFEQATTLQHDATWLSQARGKSVKLALPLVMYLPPNESYRLILIERDLREVIASQHAMLDRLDRSSEGASLDDEALAAEYVRQRERVRLWLDRRPEVAVLPLRYDAILSDPLGSAARIACFLARKFDVAAAAAAVDPTLRRQYAGAVK
jgi:predicted AlkP superfamily phosphohydrolase/phosphomutase/tetratricopeptide (TPR) repeat protein